MKVTHVLTCAIAALWGVAPDAAKAAEQDFEAWQTVVVAKPLAAGQTVNVEFTTRMTDDASNFGAFLFRPSFGLKVSKTTEVSAGYAYIWASPKSGSITEEHEAWEQLTYALIAKPSVVSLSSRTRLEERFRNDGDDVGIRLRQQLRLTLPVSNTGVDGIVWTEGFFNLNSTDWRAREGFDRWRTFVGAGVPVSSRHTIEVGYLNQYINGVKTDTVDNIFNTTLRLKF